MLKKEGKAKGGKGGKREREREKWSGFGEVLPVERPHSSLSMPRRIRIVLMPSTP